MVNCIVLLTRISHCLVLLSLGTSLPKPKKFVNFPRSKCSLQTTWHKNEKETNKRTNKQTVTKSLCWVCELFFIFSFEVNLLLHTRVHHRLCVLLLFFSLFCKHKFVSHSWFGQILFSSLLFSSVLFLRHSSTTTVKNKVLCSLSHRFEIMWFQLRFYSFIINFDHRYWIEEPQEILDCKNVFCDINDKFTFFTRINEMCFFKTKNIICEFIQSKLFVNELNVLKQKSDKIWIVWKEWVKKRQLVRNAVRPASNKMKHN